MKVRPKRWGIEGNSEEIFYNLDSYIIKSAVFTSSVLTHLSTTACPFSRTVTAMRET